MKLTINKREYDFAFGLGFLGEALEDLNVSIENIGDYLEKNPIKVIPALMYHSARYALVRQDKEVDFTKFDFFDDLDANGLDGDLLSAFNDAFVASLMRNVPKDKDEDNDKSKKK